MTKWTEASRKVSLTIWRPRGGCKSDGLFLNSWGFFASHLQGVHGLGGGGLQGGSNIQRRGCPLPPFWPGCPLWALLSSRPLEAGSKASFRREFAVYKKGFGAHTLSPSLQCPVSPSKRKGHIWTSPSLPPTRHNHSGCYLNHVPGQLLYLA